MPEKLCVHCDQPMKTLKEPPADYQEGDTLMSNFDHEVDHLIEEKMKREKIFCAYPGWNFYGTVWFEDGQFHCTVKQYHVHVDTISADSAKEIMEEVSEKYGHE